MCDRGSPEQAAASIFFAVGVGASGVCFRRKVAKLIAACLKRFTMSLSSAADQPGAPLRPYSREQGAA